MINSRTAFGDSDVLYLFIYLLYIYLFYTNAFNSPYLYHIAQHVMSYGYSLAVIFLPPLGSDAPRTVIFKCPHQFIPHKFKPFQHIKSAHVTPCSCSLQNLDFSCQLNGKLLIEMSFHALLGFLFSPALSLSLTELF